MYNSSFVCTYQRITDYDDSLIIYQVQFLQAFNVITYDDAIINSITSSLYNDYKDNDIIANLINIKKTKLSEENLLYIDDLTIFRTYFGYDTFHVFHSILSSLINKTEIDDKKYDILINK